MTDEDPDRFVLVLDGPCAGQSVEKLRSSVGNWWVHACVKITRLVQVGEGGQHDYRYDVETDSYVYEGGEENE